MSGEVHGETGRMDEGTKSMIVFFLLFVFSGENPGDVFLPTILIL